MAKQTYDLLVIGAGPAGSGAASAAAEQGHRVALAERDEIGGTCLNYGCDPTKALLHSARLLHNARDAGRYGLRIRDAEVDWAALQARVRGLIDRLRGGSDEQAREKMAGQGIHVLRGAARFVSAHEVAVGEQLVRADHIIIAAGSAPVVPDVAGLRDAGFITNREALALPRLPRRLAIIGGGPIGIEFAQMFRRFGVDVTMLEQGEIMLAKDDRELAGQLCSLLEGEGIRMETEVELRRIRRDGEQKRLTMRCGDRTEEQLAVDEILVATGYKPALEALDLAAAGVESSDEGITTDATLRTSVPHIWAAGDILGGYQFTHVAFEHGRLATHNAFAAEPRPFDDRAIPWVTYTDPELAHVGKTEEQLRKANVAYRVGRKKMDAVERAVVTEQTAGLVKLLVNQDGMIAGGHILAAEAGELIASIVLAMRSDLPARALASAILPYPTLAEAVRWAAEDSAGAS